MAAESDGCRISQGFWLCANGSPEITTDQRQTPHWEGMGIRRWGGCIKEGPARSNASCGPTIACQRVRHGLSAGSIHDNGEDETWTQCWGCGWQWGGVNSSATRDGDIQLRSPGMQWLWKIPEEVWTITTTARMSLQHWHLTPGWGQPSNGLWEALTLPGSRTPRAACCATRAHCKTVQSKFPSAKKPSTN